MTHRWMAGLLVVGMIGVSAVSAQSEDSHDEAAMMARAAAEEAVAQGKINSFKLPKNKGEEKELDEACLKGPRAFYGWFLPKEKLPDGIPQTWAGYGSFAKNVLDYCHLQTAEYRKARSGIAMQKTTPAENAGVSSSSSYPRWPRNAKEEAEFRAAIKKGLYPCVLWLSGPEEMKGSSITPSTKSEDIGFPSAEAYCRSLAGQFEMYETMKKKQAVDK